MDEFPDQSPEHDPAVVEDPGVSSDDTIPFETDVFDVGPTE